MADQAGIDFMLPIGRWKGYGGDTNFHGATLETVTWACGLLAATERITVFGTVHAPLFHPLIAAKEFVTADHIGEGRFGINLVVGWNEGEFEMFGVTQREHDARYDYAQEWLDVIKRAWTEHGDFDFAGRYLNCKGVRAYPKPYGDTRPIIMNAGRSPIGQAFALRNCDAFFTATVRLAALHRGQREEGAGDQERRAGLRPRDRGLHRRAGDLPADAEGGRGLLPVCRHRQCRLGRGRPDDGAEEHHAADRRRRTSSPGSSAISPARRSAAIRSSARRTRWRRSWRASVPAGMRGIAVSFVNYLNETPYFCDEVLPRLVRLGVRHQN